MKLLKKWLIAYRDKKIAKHVLGDEFRDVIKGVKIEKKLTPAQKREVQAYFLEHYGQKITLDFHEFYNQFENFSIRYIPTNLYRSQLIYKLNDFRMKDAYADKNIYDKIFCRCRAKQPEAILRCINGLFYSEDYHPLTKEEALKHCSNLSEVIIKPTMETAWGKGVRLISVENGIVNTGESLEKLFKDYRKHFIIQKRVKQHPAIAALNPSSVNTIRVLTYRRPNTTEIIKLYSYIRIGGKGAYVDNMGSGGYSVKIESTGRLARFATLGIKYGTNTCKTHSDTDICLDGYAVPSYDKIIAACIDLHHQLPYFNLVGWDMSVDKEGTPVMIEWNVSPEMHQHCMGPVFGEYTEEVLQHCQATETTRYIKLVGRGFAD